MTSCPCVLSGPARAAFFCCALLGGAASSTAAARSLDFEQVFAAVNEPATLRFKAVYEDARGKHMLEVSREGQHRLRRHTDNVLDVLAVRQGDEELQLTVLDHARRIRTDVSRTSLYRVGEFTDWYALAHGIRKPAGAYALTRLTRAPMGEAPVLACRWYALVSEGKASNVCWSEAYRLPMVITDATGHARWKVTAVDTRPLPPSAFQLDDHDYIRVHADEDIRGD